MFLQQFIAHAVEFVLRQYGESVPPQLKRGLYGPVLVLTLVQEIQFEGLAEFQVLFVQRP